MLFRSLFSTNATVLGATPQYIWQRNSLSINNIGASYRTDSLRSGDSIRVIATSSERCLTTLKATSNVIAPKVNLCNAVVDNFESTVQIFPNPSQEARLTVSGLNYFDGNKTIALFNANGQFILSKTIEKGVNEAVLDCKTPIANGFYWVKITTEKQSFYKKWVLEK